MATHVGRLISTDRLTRVLTCAALIVVAGIGLGVVLDVVYQTIFSLSTPYSTSFTGGLLGWWVLNPDQWYAPINVPPYVPTIYPPGHFLTIGVAHDMIGGSVFRLQRIIGQVAAIGTAGIIALLGYRITDRPLGAVGGLLYVLSPAVSSATVWGRVDHLAVFFGVLALAIAILWSHPWWWVSVVPSVAAVFTKPTLGVVPLAIVVALVVKRRYRHAIEFSSAGAIIVLSWLASMSVGTGGRVLDHLITYNAAQPVLLDRLLRQTWWVTWLHLPILAVAAVVCWLYRDEWDLPVVVPIFTILGGALLVATAGREGSWIGYSYPMLVGACLCVAYAMAVFVPRWRGSMEAWTAAGRPNLNIGLLLITIQLVLFAAWTPTPVSADNQARVEQDIQVLGGPVLSEDSSIIVRTGGGEAFDPLMAKFLAHEGVWDDRVTPRIRAQEYRVIVMMIDVQADRAWSGSRWTRDQVEAVREAYHERSSYGRYHVYVPVQRMDASSER